MVPEFYAEVYMSQFTLFINSSEGIPCFCEGATFINSSEGATFINSVNLQRGETKETFTYALCPHGLNLSHRSIDGLLFY
ncbi:unnamed protein product [Rhodiola kirilowii]